MEDVAFGNLAAAGDREENASHHLGRVPRSALTLRCPGLGRRGGSSRVNIACQRMNSSNILFIRMMINDIVCCISNLD